MYTDEGERNFDPFILLPILTFISIIVTTAFILITFNGAFNERNCGLWNINS
jgi:hypothetical protein